jgi:hypothetical protein
MWQPRRYFAVAMPLPAEGNFIARGGQATSQAVVTQKR